jgi:phage terminase large subunit GpA-like protein
MKNGVRLWKIGVSIIKSELFNALKKSRSDDENLSGAASRCHFPEYNTEYFKQLTAEQMVTRIVKGYPKRIWQKTRDRNEALDCRVYARAAAIALGLDHWSENKWEQLASQAGVTIPKKSVGNIEEETPQQHKSTASVGKAVLRGARPRIVRSSMMILSGR